MSAEDFTGLVGVSEKKVGTYVPLAGVFGKVAGAYVSAGAALAALEHVIIIGASLEAYSFGQYNEQSTSVIFAQNRILAATGKTVVIHNHAIAGSRVEDLATMWPDAKATYAALPGGGKTLVLLCHGGNNIVSGITDIPYAPYTGYKNTMLGVIAEIEALGWDWMVPDLTYRDYNIPTARQERMKGSWNWNINVPKSINAARTKKWGRAWTYADGTSWGDLYSLVRNNRQMFASPAGDATHFNSNGYLTYRTDIVDRILIPAITGVPVAQRIPHDEFYPLTYTGAATSSAAGTITATTTASHQGFSHIGIYSPGSNPSAAEVVAGTGAGFVAKLADERLGTNDTAVVQSVTGLGVGTAYRVCMVFVADTTQTASIAYSDVTTAGTDVTAPTLSSAAISNAAPTVVSLTYSEALNTTAPAASAFTIGGTLATAKAVSTVSISGTVVTVTASSAFVAGDAPTITYVVPGTNPVRDPSGNAAAALTAQAVSNNVNGDVTAPTLSTAAIANSSPSVIALTYNETLNATAPATSAFTVGGTVATAKTISSVSISGAVVSVTVSSPFVVGDAPTITYAAPGSNALKDVAGNNAVALTAQAVTNNVSASTTATVILLRSFVGTPPRTNVNIIPDVGANKSPGVRIANAIDLNGATTGVSFEILAAFDSANSFGRAAAFVQDKFVAGELDQSWTNTTSVAEFKLNGLNPAKSYVITMSANRDDVSTSTGRRTAIAATSGTVTSGATSQMLDGANQATGSASNFVAFTMIPTAAGAVSFNVQRFVAGAGTAYLGGIHIQAGA